MITELYFHKVFKKYLPINLKKGTEHYILCDVNTVKDVVCTK